MDTTLTLQNLERIAQAPPKDESTRRQLYEAARNLMQATEPHHEMTHRIWFSQILITIVKVAGDVGIFKALATKNSPCTAEELSKETKADELVISRIGRGLAAHGLVIQTPDGSFLANKNTIFFAEEFPSDAVDHNQITVGGCLSHLPEFLAANGGRNPDDKLNTPFQLAFKTKQSPFEWFPTQPRLMKAMIGNMAISRAGQSTWFSNPDCFSMQDFTLPPQDIEKGRVLMVDVGGGGGQQCVALRTSQPTIKGRVILQDTSPVIESLPKDQLSSLDIEWQGSDFFQSQSVHGAKVYYLRNIIHDWPDRDCVTILGLIRQAMAPDSILVLDEIVLETTANWKQVNYDITMMACLGAMERTRIQFSELFAQAGFKLRDVKVYDTTMGDSVLYAVPI